MGRPHGAPNEKVREHVWGAGACRIQVQQREWCSSSIFSFYQVFPRVLHILNYCFLPFILLRVILRLLFNRLCCQNYTK